MLSKNKFLECCKLLKLDEVPNTETLKTGYREQMRIWHPDLHVTNDAKHKYATEKAKEINASYEFLSELLETNSSQLYSTRDFEEFSKNYDTQHTYKNKIFTPGFPDPEVFEVFLKSEAVISAGFNQLSKILYLKFIQNRVYKYHNFPKKLYNELLQAPSYGRFIIRYITTGEFKFELCLEPNQKFKKRIMIN